MERIIPATERPVAHSAGTSPRPPPDAREVRRRQPVTWPHKNRQFHSGRPPLYTQGCAVGWLVQTPGPGLSDSHRLGGRLRGAVVFRGSAGRGSAGLPASHFGMSGRLGGSLALPGTGLPNGPWHDDAPAGTCSGGFGGRVE